MRHMNRSRSTPDPRRGDRPPVRGEQGTALLEFALLVPVLLMLVFGVIQYGLYFWAMQGGSDIARDAVRLSAVGVPGDCVGLRDEVQRQVEALNGFGESVSVTRTYLDTAPAGINVGDIVEVTVEFRSVDLNLPFVPFVDDGVIESTVQARVEFVPTSPESCPA